MTFDDSSPSNHNTLPNSAHLPAVDASRVHTDSAPSTAAAAHGAHAAEAFSPSASASASVTAVFPGTDEILLSAPKNMTLEILSAEYGPQECPLDFTAEVRSLLDLDSSRRLSMPHGANDILTDPCPGTEKVIKLKYRCISPK